MTPRHQLIIALALAILTPYVARIPGMMTRGPDWLWSYFPSLLGVLFFAAFASIAGFALYALARAFPAAPKAFWFGATAMVIALLPMHATLDLASDSTAAVALVIFPILATIALSVVFLATVLVSRYLAGPK